MKRSRINQLIAEAKEFFQEYRFALPPWAFWKPEDWKGLGDSDIVRTMLGWDLTDYGEGAFEKKGLILFTLRNGVPGGPGDGTTKPYAEKIMIVREGQICPMHFHWTKMEDIINRGGGNLMVELWNADKDGNQAPGPVTVLVDGLPRTVESGESIRLAPGESVTLERGQYHAFTGEQGKGKVLVGEVSTVNDDNTDNRFSTPLPRFPEIEEDEAPLHLLVTDYPDWV